MLSCIVPLVGATYMHHARMFGMMHSLNNKGQLESLIMDAYKCRRPTQGMWSILCESTLYCRRGDVCAFLIHVVTMSR